MNSSQLDVSLVQTDIVWMDIEENLNFLDEKLSGLHTDLIVLPEMFNTGFSMKPQLTAEKMNGTSITWMRNMASRLKTAICGSLAICENNHYYNRFVFVFPDGKMEYYDKVHLFTYAGEHLSFSKGNQHTFIKYRGFVICPFICYDLRFPVWNRVLSQCDMALYVANWPASRCEAWNSLLKARAIENMCYVVAVNRVGVDGNQLLYQGDSKVLNPLGELVDDCKDHLVIKQVLVSKQSVDKVRSMYRFLGDQDTYYIE